MKNIFTHRLTKRFLSVAMGMSMLTVLVIGNVGTAFADTFPVNPGDLSVNPDPAITFSSDAAGTTPITNFTLTGTNQTIYIQMPIKVVDARGSGAGWVATLYGSAFASGSHHLSTPAITNIENLSVGTGSSGLNGSANSGALGTPGSWPADSGSKQTLLTAASAGDTYGMGTYTFDVKISQAILAHDYAGADYTTTFHIDVA